MLHNGTPMLLKDRKRDEEMEVAAEIIRPQDLPEPQYIGPFKFALVPNKKHAEKEEEVCGVSRLQMQIQGRIHKLYQVIEREELSAHPRLVAQEIAFHPFHESTEAPKCNRVILLDSVDGSEEVTHALHIPKVSIVFVVSQEHVFELLHVNVGAGLCKWRVWVGMWYVFALE